MARIDQSSLRGKIRDLPISPELETVLLRAADAAGVDTVFVTSGGQPGTKGKTIGSTRHNGGRAADLQLIVNGVTQSFSDLDGGDTVERFVTSAAANGANGIGAGVQYMGPQTLHIGFGQTVDDHRKIVWGADGESKNAPQWLRDAAQRGWENPPAWAFAKAERSHEQEFQPRNEAEIHEVLPDRFNIDVVLAAQASQRRLGIPASVTLAQWAVESAYGARMPPGSKNPFGIKAKPGQPSVMAWTKEEVNGRMVSIRAAFRVFGSLEEAFVKHGELLAFGKPYAAARKFKDDPNRFADALTGVYATDSNYGTMLKSIMRKNDLYRFDSELSVGGTVDMGDREDDMITAGGIGGVDPLGVKALQERLVELGYPLGKIDGKFGTLTAAALLAFQHDNGLPTSGVVDQTTAARLRDGPKRRLDDERVRASEKDLANEGSRIVIDARRGRVLSWLTGALGALGIGNSAVMNAGGATAGRSATAIPDGLLPFLADVQKLTPSSGAAEYTRLSGLARTLSEQLNAAPLPPDLVRLVDQVRRSLPPDLLTRNPDASAILESIGKVTSVKAPAMSTIFDILPTFFANDSVLQTVMKGVAAIAASTLPGFGGSLAVLGVGLAGRFLANRIAAARVEDHQHADNIRPLKD